MTENDEKLWKEIENCLEYDGDIYCYDPVFLETTSIENLMDWFKNKQTDLLKEFVVYLQSTEKYKAIDEYIDTMGVSWGKRYMSANHQLNQDLEKFLEERK